MLKIRLLLFMLIVMIAAVPAAAQDSETLTVSTGGIMLAIDKDFATGVSINALPPVTADSGMPEPASTQIAFSNPPPGFAAESILTLRFYRIADMAAFPDYLMQVTQLQELLAAPSDETLAVFMQPSATLEGDARLPFLPSQTHGAAVQARAAFFETPFMRGVRYIVAFSADVSPFTQNSFVYGYQAVTNDNEVYVSGSAFLSTDLFPAEMPPIDPAAFFDNLPNYLTETIATLNQAAPEDFSPSLADIDAIMESITVTPVQ